MMKIIDLYFQKAKQSTSEINIENTQRQRLSEWLKSKNQTIC